MTEKQGVEDELGGTKRIGTQIENENSKKMRVQKPERPTDLLTLLREYTTGQKEIIEKDGSIFFDKYAWTKSTKTNYQIFGSAKKGCVDYYTLECLVFLIKNQSLAHPKYVNLAISKNKPVVRRPDRKDLLAYLNGNKASSNSIDRSMPLIPPINADDVKSETEEMEKNI